MDTFHVSKNLRESPTCADGLLGLQELLQSTLAARLCRVTTSTIQQNPMQTFSLLTPGLGQYTVSLPSVVSIAAAVFLLESVETNTQADAIDSSYIPRRRRCNRRERTIAWVDYCLLVYEFGLHGGKQEIEEFR